MDDLIPNPDRCEKFQPNPFKKEKCKHCGRPWNEHLGVISEDIVRGFVQARQKVAEEKQRLEAEAKAKVRAKAAAKKKATQAVEDEWFFDEPKDDKNALDAESDDDLGFRMFLGENLESTQFSRANSTRDSSAGLKPLKVVNLIDFDALQEEELAAAQRALAEAQQAPPAEKPPPPPPPPPRPSISGDDLAMRAAGGEAGDATGVPGVSPLEPGGGVPATATKRDSTASLGQLVGAEEEDEVHSLVSEIEYLRQMLANAKEETNIQVDIVRDEVAEKQKVIEELKREMVSLQAQTKTGCSGSNSEVEALRAELSRQREGSERLQKQALTELEQLRAENRQLHAETNEARRSATATNGGAKVLGIASNDAFLSSLVSELVSSSLRIRRVLANEKVDGDKDGAEVSAEAAAGCTGDMETDLRGLKEAHALVERAVDHLASDRRHLTLRVNDLEKKVAFHSTGTLSPGASKRRESTPLSPSHSTNEAVGKQATEALREIRLNAEQHLAWIRKRVKRSTDHQVGGPLGMPNVDALGGGC
eukprot:TRINITY_DN21619_c0_g1_i1.p1 TRINITY_DN21619_c0_g1~~TRINITY_DN21619_c0_g1_i1.p1  ORF type:complete len:535 (-),score=131.08 TRINITY_DN21619_c0_g1_i1:213-1817(-)